MPYLLTPQQAKVLLLLSRGLLNKQIAYELNVSEATAKAHVSAVLRKLHVKSRAQAAQLAVQHKHLESDVVGDPQAEALS